jgi:hypothetical protein
VQLDIADCLPLLLLPTCSSGFSRAEAGKVELDGATYAGFNLPFSITQLVWIEAILVGGAELYRNSELDPERRCYPGARNSLQEAACRTCSLNDAVLVVCSIV